MLKELNISNFALMDNLELALSSGFNIFTGETGAGKSNLIDAIGLLTGGRAREEYIRAGEDEAYIEAVFDISSNESLKAHLTDKGFEAEEEVLISRIISRKGKNSCRVNGRLVTSSMLSKIGAYLIEIQGQHENQTLLRVSSHLDILDEFCGETLVVLREEVREKYLKFKALEKEIIDIRNKYRQDKNRNDFLRFEINEIEEAGLLEGEDEKLLKEKRTLSNIDKLKNLFSQVLALFRQDMGLDFFTDEINRHLRDIAAINSDLTSFLERFEGIYYEIQDFSVDLGQYYEELDFDPERLDEIMSRLDLINKLKNKYGNSIAEILAYLDNARKDFLICSNYDETIKELQEKLDRQKKELLGKGLKLSSRRKKGAKSLIKAVSKELEEIGMGKAAFDIAFNSKRLESGKGPGEKGMDDIEFLFTANPGEPIKPLVKIASGGEMSRVMLALKSALAGVKFIPSLIFDEVDAGLGGEAASLVGGKLLSLCKSYQVICVTHLPQIACLADSHFYLFKTEIEGRIVSRIKELDKKGRVEEISRMLAGEEKSAVSEELAVNLLGLKK